MRICFEKIVYISDENTCYNEKDFTLLHDTASGQDDHKGFGSTFPSGFSLPGGFYFCVMNDGWIKLYRKFDEWEWFNISEMVHLFIYLLLNANHEDGEWRGVAIKRGQVVTGLHKLHEKTKISFQTIRTCLSRLKKTGEINIQTTNQYSIITILNYESYQSDQQTTNKRSNKRLTNDQQTTNNKQEYKEGEEVKNIRSNPSKSGDFIDEIIEMFVMAHGSYEIINRGQERQAAGKLLNKYKEKHPAATSEEVLVGLRKYFDSCLNINDDWLRMNMSLPIIISKFNQINKILKNGGIKKSRGASDIDIAELYASKHGIDSPGRQD